MAAAYDVRMKLRCVGLMGLFVVAAVLLPAQVLYVADNGTGTISRVDLAGNVSTFATGFANIYGLAGDAQGNVYVSST